MSAPCSLPDFVEPDAFGGWEAYEDALYAIHQDEIAHAGFTFNGCPVRCRHHEARPNGKGYGFWHLITEGKTEDTRTPDPERCRRIRWVAWVLRRAETSDEVRWWTNKRYGNTHVTLWLWKHGFAVILAERPGYYVLKTAYPLLPHRARSFEKEWRRSQTAP